MYEKQANQQMIELEKQVALSVTESKSKYLKEKYKDYPKVVEYLDNLFKDIAENHAIFRSEEAPANKALPQFAGGGEAIDHFDKYKVNVFVNNEKCAGAPVIIESNPNYYNLFGKLEYRSKMLSMSTDYTMIRPGALHKANGGYLIIDAKDVLSDPFAWNTLKKSLKYGQIEIENIGLFLQLR